MNDKLEKTLQTPEGKIAAMWMIFEGIKAGGRIDEQAAIQLEPMIEEAIKTAKKRPEMADDDAAIIFSVDGVILLLPQDLPKDEPMPAHHFAAIAFAAAAVDDELHEKITDWLCDLLKVI
jgi:hypothetical protein